LHHINYIHNESYIRILIGGVRTGPFKAGF
jgi:hypothetical protein